MAQKCAIVAKGKVTELHKPIWVKSGIDVSHKERLLFHGDNAYARDGDNDGVNCGRRVTFFVPVKNDNDHQDICTNTEYRRDPNQSAFHMPCQIAKLE